MSAPRGATQKQVQRFYDDTGWKKCGQGLYADAVLFEDLREVSGDYIRNCHLRVNRYLPGPGDFLLDVASGPVQYAEYLAYGDRFGRRLCVDLSLTALREARDRLGDRGLYVAADVVNLPFKSGCVAAVVSLHTLYHVPAAEQAQAWRELYRVLQPGGRAVIVYNWGDHALLMNLLSWPLKIIAFPGRLVRYVRRCVAAGGASRQAAQVPGLYFHAHNLRWFEANVKPEVPYRIFVWRSLSVGFLKGYIHAALGGKRLLAAVYRLEERYPGLLGRLGQYPLFVVDKP